MKLRAYNVPTKDGHVFFIPEDPFVITKEIGRSYMPEDPFVITRSMARSYVQERRKNERFQVVLLTSKLNEDEDKLKKIAERGLLDTAYRDEKLMAESIKRLNQWYIGIHLTHWFYRYFLGPLLIAGSLWDPFDIAAGIQLIFGRSIFVRWLQGLCSKFFDKIARGVEFSLKHIDSVEEREDSRLKRLEEIIASHEDKTEAYKRAYHACDELGLPQLKSFYFKSMPMDEWKIQEPHMYFYLDRDEERPPTKSYKRKKYRGRRVKPMEADLFDYNVSAKDMRGIKRYSDLEKMLKDAAKRGGFEEIPLYELPSGRTVWAYAVGNPKGEEFLIKAGCHGGEDASPRAVLQMMRSLGGEGRYTEEVLQKSRITFMPCDDPDGFDMRSKAFVDMSGHEEHWPVQRGLVRFRDANGVWGDHARSPRILAIQEYIREVKPTFAVDLHETVFGNAYFWAKGAGILSIEDFYIPVGLRRKAERMKEKEEGVLDRLLSRIPFGRDLLDIKYTRDIMRKNPDFELGEAMMNHVVDKGFRTFNMDYQRLVKQSTSPLTLPQLIFFDEGRCIDGPLLFDLDIRVCTAWLHHEFGTLAYTSETFPNPMDERILEDLAYVEGGIMKRLRIGRYAG
ncbi:MAG: M14 family zinc carboxypeptidase [Candidatus Geothermarchaeales archaeon]